MPPSLPIPSESLLPSITALCGSLCFSEKRPSCSFCYSDGTRRDWGG